MGKQALFYRSKEVLNRFKLLFRQQEKRLAPVYGVLSGAIAVMVIFGWAAPAAEAASFLFSSGQSSYAVQDTFSVTVSVSSPERAINAVSGVVAIPEGLDVLSVSRDGSVVGFWTQPPTFSQGARTVSFEGVVLNPGYQGAAGTLFQIKLRAIREGTGTVSLMAGSILAHDGQGTNVMDGPSAAMNLTTAPAPSAEAAGNEPRATPAEGEDPSEGEASSEAAAEKQAPPSAPRLTSPTHATPETWSSSSHAVVEWRVPKGVTAVRTGVSKGANDAPRTLQGPVGVFRAEGLSDGVWVVHVQLQNGFGWGSVAHREVRIDTAPPKAIQVSKMSSEDLSNPDVPFIFQAEDTASGVARYNVRFDDAEEIAWIDDGSHTFLLTDVPPGVHRLSVRASDHAGNATSTDISFFVDALQAPRLTEVSSEIRTDTGLLVRGVSAYPMAQAVLWLQPEEGEATRFLTAADEHGAFFFQLRERIPPGHYRVSAEIIDARGALSNRSKEVPLEVRRSWGEYGILVAAVLLIAACLFAGLFWRERTLRGSVQVGMAKDEDELLALAHRMRQKLRALEERERTRRRAADKVIHETEAQLAEELEPFVRRRTRRSPDKE
ncbi:MAG: hypothetical protein RL141_1107 [Candidatus Parcubacteria bacterium]|jgi:hypothetical protein